MASKINHLTSEILDTIVPNLKSDKDNHIIIGFANEFYTLYKYEYRTTDDIQSGKKNIRSFSAWWIKNISKSEEVVKTLYPNSVICKELNGSKCLYGSEKGIYNPDTQRIIEKDSYDYDTGVPFGMYAGQKFSQVRDLDYLCWMVNKIRNRGNYTRYYDERLIQDKPAPLDRNGMELKKVAAIDRIVELGGKYFCGDWIDPISLQTTQGKELKSILEKAERGEEIEFTFSKNLDNLGYLNNVNGFNCVISFDNITYPGLTKLVTTPYGGYGMLKCKDGKYHKVTNRKFRFKDYRFVYDSEGTAWLDVHSYEEM